MAERHLYIIKYFVSIVKFIILTLCCTWSDQPQKYCFSVSVQLYMGISFLVNSGSAEERVVAAESCMAAICVAADA